MSSSEDEVNFFSPKFNPLKALGKSNISLPFPDAPTLDNISRFEMDSEGKVTMKELKRKKVVKEKEEEEQPSTSTEVTPLRRFESSQLPVQGRRKNLKNILTRMEEMTGPLAQLRICMELRRRVKVITRRGHEIRGSCEGFVQAFDKHWNIALSDVREVFKRKRPSRYKSSELGKEISDEECERRRRLVGIKIPKRVILKQNTKNLEVERFVSQLFLRGEHVVSIILLGATE